MNIGRLTTHRKLKAHWLLAACCGALRLLLDAPESAQAELRQIAVSSSGLFGRTQVRRV